MVLLSIALTLLVLISQVFAQDLCFIPDGNEATDLYFCNATAGSNGDGSACCSAGDTCLQNGACFQGWSGIFYRGGCSDPAWNSSSCLQVARQEMFESLLHNVLLLPCDYATQTWCVSGPGQSGSCCDNRTAGIVFSEWVPGYPVAVLSNDPAAGDVGNNLLAKSAVSTSSAPSTTLTSTISTSTTPSASTSGHGTATPSPSGSTPSSSSSHVTAVGLGVGLGLGLGLGLPLLIVTTLLLIFFLHARQARKRQSSSVDLLDTSSDSKDEQVKAARSPQTSQTYPAFVSQAYSGQDYRDDDYAQQQTNALGAGTYLNELAANAPVHEIATSRL